MKLKTGDHLFIGVPGCCGPHKLLVQCGSHKRILCWGYPDYKIGTTIHPTKSTKFRLFQPESYISGLYNPESLCNPETILLDCIRIFWLVVCTTQNMLSDVLVFGQVKKTCFYTFFVCIKCSLTALSVDTLYATTPSL